MTGTRRIAASEDPDAEDIGVLNFRPATPQPRPSRTEVESVAGYESREPANSMQSDSKQHAVRMQSEGSQHANSGQVSDKREQRRFRTGRSASITIRATQVTIDRFHAAADLLEAKAADTFERAIEALEAQLRAAGIGGGGAG